MLHCPSTNFCGTNRDFLSRKIMDDRFGAIKTLKSASPKIVIATEYYIKRLTDCVLDVMSTLFPIIVSVIFFLRNRFIFNHQDFDIRKMSTAVQNPTVSKLFTGGFSTFTPTDHYIKLFAHGSSFDDIMNVPEMKRIKRTAIHSYFVSHKYYSIFKSP
jgi:hypothetical protein